MGSCANRPFFFLRTQVAQEHTGGGGGPGDSNRRRSGHEGARLRHGTGRGDRGELDDGAHRRGGRRNRLGTAVNGGGAAGSVRRRSRGRRRAAGRGRRLAGTRAQGRLGLPFMGARARAPGGSAVQAATSGRWLGGPRRARRLGRRVRAGRTGSGLRARPIRIGFLFFLKPFPVQKQLQ
jgi:hypothetical protein